jgi:hypothetical protein
MVLGLIFRFMILLLSIVPTVYSKINLLRYKFISVVYIFADPEATFQFDIDPDWILLHLSVQMLCFILTHVAGFDAGVGLFLLRLRS